MPYHTEGVRVIQSIGELFSLEISKLVFNGRFSKTYIDFVDIEESPTADPFKRGAFTRQRTSSRTGDMAVRLTYSRSQK